MKPILQGYVTMVGRKTFWCRLARPGQRYTEYEAQVEMAKLTERERTFIHEGAYLSLLKGGTWRFSRLMWRKKDIEAFKARGAKLFNALNKLIRSQ
jgi:hypothetical protein